MRNKLRGLVGKRGAPLERADARLRFAQVIDFSIETQGCYLHWLRCNAALSAATAFAAAALSRHALCCGACS